MEDRQRPPLDADVCEAIKVEQHEIDKRYWAELELLPVSPVTRLRDEMKGLPCSPTRPRHLLRLLREYACALFDAEARKYPPGRELPRWLINLGESIEARVVPFLLRPNLGGSLDYHATAEEIKTAVHDSLKSQIEDFNSKWPDNPSPLIAENTVQLSPTHCDQPVEVSRDAQNKNRSANRLEGCVTNADLPWKN